jgi:exopolysaccharide production protein ExoQ
VSLAARTSIFAVLALLGGVGTVYAPVPTFIVVAVIFALGSWALWVYVGSGQPSIVGPRISRGGRIKPRGTRTTRLVSGYLLVFWLGLIIPLAVSPPPAVAPGTITQDASTGSLSNQVLILSFGLVGALFLPTAIRHFDRAFQWVVALWAMYLGWAATSLIWSVNPPTTFRNVGAFVLVSVGCFGLGAGFYGRLPNGRDLFLRHLFWAGVLSSLVILLPLPFRFQQYDLLSPTGRLLLGADFGQLVTQPVMLVLLALVATPILGVRRWQKRDWFWVAVFVFTLLALKSRGPVLWGMIALGIFYLFSRTRLQDRVLQVGLLLVIGVGTYLYYSENVLETTFGPLVEYLTRGNVEATMNLTGRVPLWQILLEEIGERPWLGVGFTAYWSSLSLLSSFQVQDVVAPSAHNGYLEELLNTGVVGLAILLTFCLVTLGVVRRQALRGDPLGWLVFLYMVYFLLLNLTNAVTQEYFEPSVVVILVTLGLMASRPAKDPPTSPRAPAATFRHVATPPR